VRGHKLIVRTTNLLVKLDVRAAAQAASLSRDCGMKNSADEEGVIPDMRPKQKRLFGSRAVQGNQDIGNVLFATGRIRRDGLGAARWGLQHLHPARARKRFQQRRDVVAELAVADSALLQNVPGQNVKIELRRYPQMSAVIQDCINQSRMIENGIARFDIAQKIDKRDLVGLRPRERAHDEVEIGGREPRPTIRPDHRDFIMRDGRAYGKSDC
jgi:hypothetical protein